jgi:hypothetical protein
VTDAFYTFSYRVEADWGIAEQFWAAARDLIEFGVANQTGDAYVRPILFSYRLALELGCKHIARLAAYRVGTLNTIPLQEFDERLKGHLFFTQGTRKGLVEIVRDEFAHLELNGKPLDLPAQAVAAMELFDGTDPQGFAFRYYADKIKLTDGTRVVVPGIAVQLTGELARLAEAAEQAGDNAAIANLLMKEDTWENIDLQGLGAWIDEALEKLRGMVEMLESAETSTSVV